ncbi:MAG TPA: hypothetical protein VNN80_04440 [Polyangiaceae bacterium]|jgi:nitrate/TMAO reductase-like tetraheme cytochrome c subunit|nr:hypothetical protein [Polyangiaceae bacterium]
MRARAALLRIALLGFGLGSAGATCNGPHETPPVGEESCVTCHQPDYEDTQSPAHGAEPAVYHQRCVDCHSTERWAPALKGPHPNDRFDIGGPAHDYACLDCHSFERGDTSVGGADVDCVGCHDGAHSPSVAIGRHLAVPSFRLEEYVFDEPPWCMPCHDGGRGFGKNVPHPEESFPILTAPHNYECQECHDTTRATTLAGNTNCSGCHDQGAHSQANEVDNHVDVAAYVFDPARPDFCLDCHAQPDPLDVPVPFRK